MNYSDIKRADNGGFIVGPIDGVPDISGNGTEEPAAWFLGPRAENREHFNRLIEESLDHIYRFRENYIPSDPPAITDRKRRSVDYRTACDSILAAHRELLGFFNKYATPYFSLRYQGHMLWDTTMPAMAGYFAAMLHNPNNAGLQASTSTTPLAILVGWDLCRMIGFPFNKGTQPWSHITADGTLANIEATWAVREAKFLPFAARALLKSADAEKSRFKAARSLEIRLCDGSATRLADASNWELFNVPLDEALALPPRIAEICSIQDIFAVWDRLIPFTLNARGWTAMLEATRGLGGAPIIMAPSSKHYGWPKAAAVCGYGSDSLTDIHVDADGRMDLIRLDEKLAQCLKDRIPVAQVVAVAGSTEESAVDPLEQILDLRETYRRRGLDFAIHADAAWGGYAVTGLRRAYRLDRPDDEDAPFVEDVSAIPTDAYVTQQLTMIRHCDSATIDPHKWGYVPYPAGSVLYRNGDIRRLTTFTGACIGGIGSIRPEEPSVGVFGLEGSRPGASAAAVFLSHRCIRPDTDGYGRIVSTCLANTRKFYLSLLRLNEQPLPFTVTPLSRLPAERRGEDPEMQMRFIRERLFDKSDAEIMADAEAAALFRELGPDLNILAYAFNFRRRDGSINTDADAFNRFNGRVYDTFRIRFEQGQILDEHRYILTKTTFYRNEYGDVFVDAFADRLGLEGRPESLECLRSVIMDPYVTETAIGSFFVEIIDIIREEVSRIVETEFRDT